MEVKVEWKSGRQFEAKAEDGSCFVMGSGEGVVSPMEALLSALAACSAIDVVSILEKKRQNVESYVVRARGERPPDGTVPRPFTAITLDHCFKGTNIDPQAVERAVQLSDQKYCSVATTMRAGVTIESRWEIDSQD